MHNISADRLPAHLPTTNSFSISELAHLFQSADYNLRRTPQEAWPDWIGWGRFEHIIAQATGGCVELKSLPGNPIDSIDSSIPWPEEGSPPK